MKTITLCIILLTSVYSVGQAAVFTLTPTEAAVASTDTAAWVGFTFTLSDLTVLGEAGTVALDEVYLTWTVDALTTRATADVALFLATETWTPASLAGGSVPATEASERAVLHIGPLDQERSPGLVRLLLSGLWRELLDPSDQGIALLLRFDGVAGSDLAEQLGSARLVVHTGPRHLD